MSITAEDRIVTLPDRYVPVFQVYFAHETFSPTPGATGAPIPADAATQAEIARIKGRVVHSAGPGAPPPAQGQLVPLAGPWGDSRGQQTNDVLSVEFREDLDEGRLGTVTIDLFNVFDFSSGLYRYTDDAPGGQGPLIDYGVTIALFFGYQNVDPSKSTSPGAVAPVFEGMITTLDVNFPAEGESIVKITATDKRDRLRNQKNLRPSSFANQSEEQIAATVAAQMGLSVAVRPGQETMPDGPVQMPPDQDALQFITDRARKAALELTCFGNTIFLLTPGDSTQQALGYTYRRGLNSFSPRFDGNGKPTSVRVVARDPANQQTYTATVTPQDLQDAGLAPPGSTVADFILNQGQAGDRQEVVTNYHAKSTQEAKSIAMGILKRNLDNALTVSGELIGDPAVRAGVALDIGGVGRYGGLYYVTSATHAFGASGYKTTFQGRKNAALGTDGASQ
jgi:phage protein D